MALPLQEPSIVGEKDMETPGFSQLDEGLSQGDIPLRPHTDGPSIVVPTAHPPALPGTSSHNPQKPRLATRPAHAEKKQLLSTGSSKVAIPRQRSAAAPRYTRRVPLACESCRQRKTKCSGDTPVCRQCKELRISCRYPISWRERTKGYVGCWFLLFFDTEGGKLILTFLGNRINLL